MHGVDLHAHAELTHALGRLDERPPHVVIADKRMLIRHTRALSHTQRGIDARIR